MNEYFILLPEDKNTEQTVSTLKGKKEKSAFINNNKKIKTSLSNEKCEGEYSYHVSRIESTSVWEPLEIPILVLVG